jgi:hypothetical protein
VTKKKQIKEMGGSALVEQYKQSLLLLLSGVFPGYEWVPWRFEKCASGVWHDERNQRNFMEWAGKELKIKEMSDWYKVTNQVTCYHKINCLNKRISLILGDPHC